jgi:protein involved in polysaccharide export with SLBB domain
MRATSAEISCAWIAGRKNASLRANDCGAPALVLVAAMCLLPALCAQQGSAGQPSNQPLPQNFECAADPALCATNLSQSNTQNPYGMQSPYGGMGMPGSINGITDLNGLSGYTGIPTQPAPINDPWMWRSALQSPVPVQRKPDPPTEFQNFVAAATGKMLPIFGSSLFLDVPTTFAPLDRGPVTPDYVLGPGDELQVRAWGGVTLNVRAPIDRNGNLFLPGIGVVRLAGLRFADLNGFLSQRIGEQYRKFELSVSLGQLRSIDVLVVGRARRPGAYTVSSLSTLVNVVFECGGPAPGGSMRAIELRRNGKTVTTLDLYRILTEGDQSQDAQLLGGDTIYIPPAGPRVALVGGVNVPAIYEINHGDTLETAFGLAGGLTSIAALERADLEQIGSHGDRHVTDLALDAEGMKTPLHDGDVLEVFEIVPKFDNEVILRGNVANPGRYAWRPGMRIRDLIPNRQSLVTRQAWNSRNNLALNEADRARARRAEANAAEGTRPETGTGAANTRTSNYESRQNQTMQRPALEDAEANAGNNSDELMEEDEIAARQGAMGADATGQRQTAAAPNNGAIGASAERAAQRFAPKNTVGLVAPEIDWDYAVIERTNAADLTTVLVPFHLGRVVLDGDDRENYELQPGDVVTIFSQADIDVPQKQQTKLVRLEGEFAASGVYSVRPGETLRDLVMRAGGLTGEAYLFGSSFTRESTQRQQQERLDEYTTELEQEIDLSGGNMAGTIVNAQAAAVAASSLQNQHEFVTRLRELKATGRIVLNIPPAAAGVESIPALPLEDGDEFRVPARPVNVSVVGSVYDQNSFVFEPGRNVNHYLQLAGGASKNGDWDHAFVIRADGSVVSQRSEIARHIDGLKHLRLNPGDTLVVPAHLNKSTALRGLIDWSTVFSQFAFGAAAINVLH